MGFFWQVAEKNSGMPSQIDPLHAQRVLAKNMRRFRKAKKITQEQLAEFADLHKNYVSSVERGERNVSIQNIQKIAYALGVSIAALVSAEGEED